MIAQKRITAYAGMLNARDARKVLARMRVRVTQECAYGPYRETRTGHTEICVCAVQVGACEPYRDVRVDYTEMCVWSY